MTFLLDVFSHNLHVDAISGDDEEKTKSIDGKPCPGNRSGIERVIIQIIFCVEFDLF